jgi:Iodothyronine deiodinase
LDEDAVSKQQTTLEERRQQAREAVRRLHLSLPLLLDEMDDRANVAFAAWPERLVLVGADRRIVYPGSPGPWGFSPEEAREQLEAHLGRR